MAFKLHFKEYLCLHYDSNLHLTFLVLFSNIVIN